LPAILQIPCKNIRDLKCSFSAIWQIPCKNIKSLIFLHGICKIAGKERFNSLIFLHGICQIAEKEHFKSLIFLHGICKIAGKEHFNRLDKYWKDEDIYYLDYKSEITGSHVNRNVNDNRNTYESGEEEPIGSCAGIK
jgi:hypothetical protein